MFCKNLHVEKCKKCSICLSQFFCVQQNTTQTYFSLVKFSVLSLKIKITKVRQVPAPLWRQKWNIFFKKTGLQKLIYLKMYISDFLQILPKSTSMNVLKFSFIKQVKFCLVSKWRLCSKWRLKIGFLAVTQSKLNIFTFSLLL